MIKISQDAVVEAFNHLLSPGDDVLIHAALKELGHFEGGVDAVLQALCEVVGPEGTVIMMADTRSFAKTGRFSMDMPSETGLLTERFRKMPGVIRSCVPMVSFCAWGKRADYYTAAYHSHLDEDATLTRLLEADGKILLMGIGFNKCTLYHMAEERHRAPYNFYKEFKGVLLEEGGAEQPISQRYFVRKDMSLKKNPAIAGDMMESEGRVKITPLGDGLLRVFRAREFDDCCMRALDADPEAFIERTNEAVI